VVEFSNFLFKKPLKDYLKHLNENKK